MSIAKLTFDTNCLIDLDEGEDARPQARYVKQLLELHEKGCVDIALVASSASERQKDGTFATSSQLFRSRADHLGCATIPMLAPLARWDISFWNNALFAKGNEARENQIALALFPQRNLDWNMLANAENLDPSDKSSKAYKKWVNELLDIQAFWAHEHNQREIFVTSDRNFGDKLHGHPNFPSAKALTPADTIATLIIARQNRP